MHMMTREETLSIEEYCAEHKISHKKRLEELVIPFRSCKLHLFVFYIYKAITHIKLPTGIW